MYYYIKFLIYREGELMNLLTISKKKTVTKLKDNGFAYALNHKHTKYLGSQNQMTTSHLGIRRLVSSFVPGSKTIGSMGVSEILSDKRN